MRTAAIRRRSGHTLVELIVSVAVSGILLGGVMSTLYVASRGVGRSGPTRAAVVGATAADDVVSELQYAVTFTERSASAVEFTIADRNGDNTDETIRYGWSGTAGDPLTRQYNGGAAVEVLHDVHEFALTYRVEVVTEQPPPASNESAEMLLAGYDPPNSPLHYAMTDKKWIGQYFQPSLPADATKWKVTRVRFKAKIHGGTGGVTAVQLRPPTPSNLPSSTVLDETLMYESALAESYVWQEFSFANVSGLDPSQGLCLVLALREKDADLADIQYDDAGGWGRLTTNDKGLSWSVDSSKSMVYAMHGTATTVSLPDPVTRERLQSVGVRLRVGADSSATVQTGVRVLNAPEVTAP